MTTINMADLPRKVTELAEVSGLEMRGGVWVATADDLKRFAAVVAEECVRIAASQPSGSPAYEGTLSGTTPFVRFRDAVRNGFPMP